MIDEEYKQMIKETVNDIKKSVESINHEMGQLRVDIADRYVKIAEFSDFKSKNDNTIKSIIGWIIGVFGAIIAIGGALAQLICMKV
jgi:hypothetical protein